MSAADPDGFPVAPIYLAKDEGPGLFIDLARAMKAPPLAVRQWSGFQLQHYCFPSSAWAHDAIGHVRVSIQIGGSSRMDRLLAGRRELETRGPGTISITPPGEAASWKWQDPMDVILLFLPGHILSEVACEDGGVDIEGIAMRAPLAEEDSLLTEVVKSLMSEDEGPLQDMMAATAARFVAAHLLAKYGRGSFRKTPAKGGLSPMQLKRSIEYLRDRLSEEIQLSEVAEVAGLSPSHFCRAFKTSVGMPPQRWQIVQRMASAKRMLSETEAPLSLIAKQCGYTEQSNFNKAFRRVAGTTPGAWRRERRR